MLKDQEFMARALHLAERGLWTTAPNPRVGCVLVLDGEIVGEGWHETAGQEHAEIKALKAAGSQANGATCYVTLEPCCHQGRTPPCTKALLKAGVTRVVSAMPDPDPRVAGKGMDELANNGIITEQGLLQSQAEKLNPGFIKRMKSGRPYIRLKLAMSLDGRTAMASGESKWISGPLARRDVQAWRARSSVVMTGVGTVLADDPSLNVRPEELPEYYEKPETIRQPARAIIDTHLSITGNEKMFDLPGKVVIYTATEEPDHYQLLEDKKADVVYMPNRSGGTDLVHACESLASDYEANEVLLECGANLSGAMLREGLVDELILYIAPMLMGSDARGLCNLPWLEHLGDAVKLDIQDIRAIGDDWRLIAIPQPITHP